MNKLVAVVLLAGLMLLTVLPAAAMRPIPARYFIDAGGACVAPDADGIPTSIEGSATEYWFEKGNILALRCTGFLPDWANQPKEPVKFDYGSTGLLCAGNLKDQFRLTANYGTIVYPGEQYGESATVDIMCRFNLNAQDP